MELSKKYIAIIMVYALMASAVTYIPIASADSGTVSTGLNSGAGTTVTNPLPVLKENKADDSNKGSFTLTSPLSRKFDSIGALIGGVIDIMTLLAVLFGAVMIIVVGLEYITARGNVDTMKTASKKLGWLVVGIAIVIGANIIINLVINTLEATGTVDPSVINQARDAANNR